MTNGTTAVVDRLSPPIGYQDLVAAGGFAAVGFSVLATHSYFGEFSQDALKALTLTDYFAFSISYLYPFFWFSLILFGVYYFGAALIIVPRYAMGTVAHQLSKARKRRAQKSPTPPDSSSDNMTQSDLAGKRERGSELRRGINYAAKGFWHTAFAFFLLLIIISFFVCTSILLSYGASSSLDVFLVGFILLFALQLGIALLGAIIGYAQYYNGVIVDRFDELLEKGVPQEKIDEIASLWKTKNEGRIKHIRTVAWVFGTVLVAAIVGSMYGRLLAVGDYRSLYRTQPQVQDTTGEAAPVTTAEPENQDTPADQADGQLIKFLDVEVIRVIEHGILAIDETRAQLLFVNDHGFIRAEYRLEYPGAAAIGKIRTCFGAESGWASLGYAGISWLFSDKLKKPKCLTLEEERARIEKI